MARYLIAVGGSNISGGSVVLGSSGGMLMLLCLVFMAVSIISMLVFGCADGSSKRRHRRGGFRAVYGGDTGGSGFGGGCGCGGGGGSGGCGGGGGGGGGGC